MKLHLTPLSTAFKNRKGIGNLGKISASMVVNEEQWSIFITQEMPSFGLHFQEHCLIALLELFPHYSRTLLGRARHNPFRATKLFLFSNQRDQLPSGIISYMLHWRTQVSPADLKKNPKNPFCNELRLLSLDILPVLPKTYFGKLFGFPTLAEKVVKTQ